MATEFPRPTTLAQFKTALDRTEAARQELSQELDSRRKAQVQMSKDLEAAQLKATRQQEQLAAAQAQLRQENTDLLAQFRAAQAAAEKAQADQARTEAQAAQQLLQAHEMLSRLKLEATAAADREIKSEKAIAALESQLQDARNAREADASTQEALQRLRRQLDGLVTENRLLAQARDQLSQDQVALQTAVEGHREALSKAAASARADAQQQTAQEIKQLQTTLRLSQERLATLSTQLQTGGQLEVLAPEQLGALMGRFVQQVEGGLPSLKLAEGELKLKLGLAQSGRTQGFVILQPGTTASPTGTVHEVALKFDRAGTLPAAPLIKP